MLTTLKLSRNQFSQVNWQAVCFFYAVACGLSYGLHFLPNITKGILPVHTIFTYGLGPIGAALLTRFLFRSVPKTITLAGTTPWLTALFVGVPLVLGLAFGVTNKSGQNEHVFGLLVALSGILYGFVEESGWRGFLQDALRPLPTFWRVVLIGTMWLGWHFTFLPDLSALAGPTAPFWGVYAGLILASWGLGAAADRTKSVWVVACLHETSNLLGNPVGLGVMLVAWTLLLVYWNRSSKLATARSVSPQTAFASTTVVFGDGND